MARTALTAPAHRVLQRSPLGTLYPGSSPDAAPSMDFMGQGFQDHRVPWNSMGSPAGTGAQGLGWYASGSSLLTVDEVPSAVSTSNIAAAANVTSGTAMTLVSSSGSGITVLAAGQFWWPFGNTIPSGSLIIDSTQALVSFGQNSITAYYDVTKGISRGVSITGVSGATGGHFIVSGYDYYGQAQTQNINATSGATTTNSTKTFKVITSVVPQFTDAHNYSVGTADIFGFGFAVDIFAYCEIFWNNVLQTFSTFTAADATSPATATTGDVRGTFTPGSSSDGTKRLQMFQVPSLSRAKANTLWGVTPV